MSRHVMSRQARHVLLRYVRACYGEVWRVVMASYVLVGCGLFR